jgi:hypothetical protein
VTDLAASVESPIIVRPAPPAARPTLELSELLLGAAVFAVALLAWIALALADLGWFSLGAVLGVWVPAFAAIALACRRWAPITVRVDRAGSVGMLALAVIAGFMMFPGFHYGATDKDPGGYVAHGISISRTGSYEIIDPTLDGRIPGGPVLESTTNLARFPGVWERDGHSDVVVPQFYHLWPALLAVSWSAAGEGGISNTAPLLGVLAVLAAALALRRAVRSAPWGSERVALACGAIAGLLLSTNMLEVWQAKYPSSEISDQMLFLGALLGLVIALTTGWRPAAGAAGVLVAVSFLDRADGFLLILMAVAALAGIIAIRRWDARVTWFAVGLAIVLPHSLWQAYSYDAAGRYTAANNVPSLAKLTAACLGLLLLGLVLRWIGPRIAGWLGRARIQGRVGWLVTAVAALLLALGYLRPHLFGVNYATLSGVRQRTWDEQTLNRLSWFISTPAFLLMLVGIAIVALRRWGGALWILTAPLLAIFPVYGYRARNSVRLMWWSRRFVPTVLPLVMILAGLALGVAMMAIAAKATGWRGVLSGQRIWVLRLAALASVAGLLAFYLNESWPLRKHQEWGGSFALTSRIAADAGGKQGVFLWQNVPVGGAASLFGAAIWLERGQVSALLPKDPSQFAAYVRSFQKGFPGQPVFVIWNGARAPKVAGLTLAVTDRVLMTLPAWEQSVDHRPRGIQNVPINFVIYRAQAS